MSLSSYSSDSIREIIEIYTKSFPVVPADTSSLYEDQDAIIWDGYIEPVIMLNEKLSSIFRFSKSKSSIEIGNALAPGGIESLNIEEIAYLVTDILVNEKYTLGLFGQMIVDRVIERIVCRMNALLQG